MNTTVTTSTPPPTIPLHGITLHAIGEAGVIAHILSSLGDGRGGVVVTPNLDHLRRCRIDADFAAILSRADLAVADGMPLVWASRLQGTPLPQRVAGSNLIGSLSAAAASAGRSVYLLGGAPGTAEAAGRILQDRHPGLTVAGHLCPPIGFESEPANLRAIGDALAAARPDIVFVALGSPKQERLIAELRQVLPHAWWLGVGISFSFLTGDVKRAPQWAQRLGLEWVHRLIQEPRRLFTRYVIQGLPFAAALFTQATLSRFAPPRHAPAQLADSSTIQHDPATALRRSVGSAPSAKQEALDPTPWSQTLADPAVAKLAEIILLGGSVRASGLARSARRAIVDLPIDDQRTILDQWTWQSAETARLMGREHLPTRLLLSAESPLPKGGDRESILIERDANSFRGAGGALRDAASAGNDDDLLLVANAAQLMLDPLPLLLSALHRLGGDAAIIAHADGTPSGAMLLPRAALKLVPQFGFVDFKEQALPIIARQFDVRVLRRARPTGLPVRSAAGYCSALRQYHRRRAGMPAAAGGFGTIGENWTSAFSIVENGANVAAGAQLHDAVVLDGASVEAGATVVRCIICPGGVVRRGMTVVDELVVAPVVDQKPEGGMTPAISSRAKPRRIGHWPLLWTDRLTAWHAVAAVWMAAIAIMATGDVWADILLLAHRDEENSHILLAPLVAIYLIWVRRQRLRYLRVRGRWIGVAIAAAGWTALTVGYARHMDGVWHGGALLVVIGCVLAVLGAQVLGAFAPAALVLVFVVPVPGPVRQAIALPLAGWSAHVAQSALQMLGVAAAQSGNTLSVNGLCINIAEACNGLRMVFALLLVCYAFCFSLPLRNSVRLLVLLASPAAALFCNVARILPTVWVYGYCTHSWGDRFHSISGWLMLPMSFLLLMALLKTMRWAMLPVTRYTLAA